MSVTENNVNNENKDIDESIEFNIFINVPYIPYNENVSSLVNTFKTHTSDWEYCVCLSNHKSNLFYRLLLKLIVHEYSFDETVNFFYDKQNKNISIDYICTLFDGKFKSLINSIASRNLNKKIKDFCELNIKLWNQYDKNEMLNKIKGYMYDRYNFEKALKAAEYDEQKTIMNLQSQHIQNCKQLEILNKFLLNRKHKSKKINANIIYGEYISWSEKLGYEFLDLYNFVNSEKFSVTLDNNYNTILEFK
jgi:hypothetical protein